MTRWLMLEKVCFLIFVLVSGPGCSHCEAQDVNPFETPELSEVPSDIKETLDDGFGPGLVRKATLAEYSEEARPRLIQVRSPGQPSSLTGWDEADPVEPWLDDRSPGEVSNGLTFLGGIQIHNAKIKERSVTTSGPGANADDKESTSKLKDEKIQDKDLQMASKPSSGTGLLHKDSHLIILTSTLQPVAPLTGHTPGPQAASTTPLGVALSPQEEENLWDGLQPESLTTLRHSAANLSKRAWLDKYHLKDRWRINAAKNRKVKLAHEIGHAQHSESTWHDPEAKDQLDSFLKKIKHRCDKDEDSMVYFRTFVAEKEGVLSDAARKLQEQPSHPNLKLPAVVH